MSLAIDSANAAARWQPPAQPASFEAPNGRAPVADGVSRMFGSIPQPDGGGTGQVGSGERELVASEDSVTAGGHRDAYDLRLYREPDGSYTLELDMKIEFDFEDGANGLNWTPEEKQAFMDNYVREVEQAWSGRTFTTDDGRQVKLDVNLDVSEQEGGFFGGVRDILDGSENYNITVVRIPDGEFHRSSVGPGNVAHLDSEDNDPANKGADMPQIGTAHEFGHMIGLPDEYNDGAHVDDDNSIMNSGMEVRERHLDIAEDWVEDNT